MDYAKINSWKSFILIPCPIRDFVGSKPCAETWRDLELCGAFLSTVRDYFDVPKIRQTHVLKVLLMKLLSEHSETQGSDRNKRDNLTHTLFCS